MVSRRYVRWFTLLLFIFVILVLLHRRDFDVVPTRSRLPQFQTSCPVVPPSPSLILSARKGFDWHGIKSHHPIQKLVVIPASRAKKEEQPRIQHDFRGGEERELEASVVQKRRQAAVKTTFTRAWKSYRERAWMKDELEPISGGSKTTFGGWGATLVDSLDTLWIMDMKNEFEDAVAALSDIDFKPNQDGGEINMFETTIRYLGGLLSAYDLTSCKDSRLLEKAMELGDMIYASFDTEHRMPVTRWSAKIAASGGKQQAAENGIIAEVASFSMEFVRLSQLTGDMRYYDAVVRVTNVLDEQQNRTKLPGLWPVGINVQAPDFTQDNRFSIGAMADSAYEYLGKTFQLLRGTGAELQYERMYRLAMDAIIENLLFRPMVPGQADILMPTTVRATGSGISKDNVAQHLVCFAGGMLALGGRLFQNATQVEFGKKITDGCVWTYENAPNGVMPEMFSMPACPSLAPCPFDSKVQQRHPGFSSVSDGRYILRPEAIESVFYMYRITGDSAYQDIAWKMFQAIDSKTRTTYANAAMRDVMSKGTDEAYNGGLLDSMESFWLAETLKYFYLVFSDPNVVSLDEWVFNTEAHPFRVR